MQSDAAATVVLVVMLLGGLVALAGCQQVRQTNRRETNEYMQHG
jgi:Tfp pilus assembly protein PilX